jgi:hypothetical protein
MHGTRRDAGAPRLHPNRNHRGDFGLAGADGVLDEPLEDYQDVTARLVHELAPRAEIS